VRYKDVICLHRLVFPLEEAKGRMTEGTTHETAGTTHETEGTTHETEDTKPETNSPKAGIRDEDITLEIDNRRSTLHRSDTVRETDKSHETDATDTINLSLRLVVPVMTLMILNLTSPPHRLLGGVLVR
jgi:hypothetical protein